MTTEDIYRLTIETGVHPNTIHRWLSGNPDINRSTDYALRAGCKKLGIEAPAPIKRNGTGTGGSAA